MAAGRTGRMDYDYIIAGAGAGNDVIVVHTPCSPCGHLACPLCIITRSAILKAARSTQYWSISPFVAYL